MTALVVDRGAARAVAPGDLRPAAGYDRISKFKTRTGVEIQRDVARQHADNTECAEDHGLSLVRYSDEGLSASRFATKDRDEFERLLVDLAAGTYSAVVMWLVDRVIRQTSDLDRVLAACRLGDAVLIQSGSGTVVHPDDPDAVAMMKIAGVLAEAEVAKTSKRVKRAMQARRDAGVAHAGQRRFGYNSDMTIREDEAAEVRRVAGDLLAGQSLYMLAKGLNERGVTGTGGAAFTGSNLSKMLARPYLAGYHTFKGEVIGDGTWEPILDRETWAALHALLSDPSRRSSTRTARRYLLTGLARCGVCDQVLRARNQGTRDLQPAYVCQTTSHVSRIMRRVDDVVTGYVGQVLSEIDGTGAPLRPEAGDRAGAIRLELETLAGNLDALAVDKALGRITERAYQAAADAVSKASHALTEELADLAVAAAVPAAVLDGLTGHAAAQCEALFLALPLDRKRAVIKALRLEITVDKASRRGGEFDPDSVRVERVV